MKTQHKHSANKAQISTNHGSTIKYQSSTMLVKFRVNGEVWKSVNSLLISWICQYEIISPFGVAPSLVVSVIGFQ